MKYCSRCGNELLSGVRYCSKCGSKVETISIGNDKVNEHTYQEAPQTINENNLVTRREIVITLILSFVTCGIYGVYWFVVMTDDVNKVSGENATSGVLSLVFSLLTCGIYSIYWNYRMGKQMHMAGKKNGLNIDDNSALYLVLSLVGLSLVNYCLIQSDLNKLAN